MKKQKCTVIITAAVMFVIGALVGFFSMKQITAVYPKLSYKNYEYIFCTVTALLLGAVLALSAKSVVFVVATVVNAFKGLAHGTKPANAVCVSVGMIAGVLLTWLLDFLIKGVITVITVRIIADVAFAVVASGLLSVAALKICGMFTKDAKKKPTEYSGFILTGKALGCDGIYEFCRDWLLDPPVVLDGTVSDLISDGEQSKKALDTYGRLQNEGCVTTVSGGREGNSIAEYARERSLKIIAATADEIDADGVLVFTQIGNGAAPSEQTLQSTCVHTVKPIDEL